MAADLAATREAMATLRRTATRADADVAAAAMEQLQTTTVTHLDHEEQETEPALPEHDGDPAVKEMGKQFSKRAGLPTAGIFFAWVQDGATPEEQSALRQSVPGPVAGHHRRALRSPLPQGGRARLGGLSRGTGRGDLGDPPGQARAGLRGGTVTFAGGAPG